MANANSTSGFTNLPAQVITTGSATALLVPAVGTYGTLPSPALAAGAGLYIEVPPDIATGSTNWDGHQFKVRLVGIVTTGTSSTFKADLYLGTSSTAASDTALTASSASAAIGTTSVNFAYEYTLLWDSVSQNLNGYFGFYINDVLTGSVAITQVTKTSTPVNSSLLTNLTFIPFFTFGTANGANSVTVKEFLIERV